MAGSNRTEVDLKPICLYHISNWNADVRIRPYFQVGPISLEGLKLGISFKQTGNWSSMVAHMQKSCDDLYSGENLGKMKIEDDGYIRFEIKDVTETVDERMVDEPKFPENFPLDFLAGQNSNYSQKFCQLTCQR